MGDGFMDGGLGEETAWKEGQSSDVRCDVMEGWNKWLNGHKDGANKTRQININQRSRFIWALFHHRGKTRSYAMVLLTSGK